MWSSAKHPDRKTLLDFLSGRIDDDRNQEQLELHLESCDECAEALGQISIDNQLLEIELPPTLGQDSASDSKLSQSLCGTWLGKYRVGDVIGQGGMGTVYQADDTVLNRRVAIKTLLRTVDSASTFKGRLIEEAQAAGAIAHPNVATVYDFLTDADVDCLVMEFLAGGSVADLTRHTNGIDWREAIRLIQEACLGVDAAHRRGILHRDIKPANLLLTRDRRVKVCDFGLATHTMHQTNEPQGIIAGTVHFMSPEQCRDEVLDARSDIYSIGATLFTLLAGRPPYREYASAEQISHAHCHAPIPDPTDIDGEIPSACAGIAMKAMAKNPNDRYASCGELLEDLSSLTSHGSQSKSSARLWRGFARLPTGPTVVVVPPESLSDDSEASLIAGGIACEINSQLSQFQNLRVVSHHVSAQDSTRTMSNEQIRRELSADYVVGGSIQRVGSRFRLTASLVATDTSATLWNHRFDRTLTDENLFEIQDEIAASVSSRLAQPYGELHRAEREKIQSESDEIGAYQSVLRFYEYWHRERMEDYWPVRNALQQTVDHYPEYAAARAALALMLVNAVRTHHLPDHDDALESAAQHAEHALKLDPKCEVAHQALVSALFHLGKMQQFAVAAEKALSAYPNHCELLADIGLFFIVTGNEKRGLPLTEKAVALSPDPPGFYFSALACNALLQADFQQALEFVRHVGEDHIWGRVLHAVALANLGQLDQAADHLRKAKEYMPDFETHFDSMLDLFHPSDNLRKVFAEGLVNAMSNSVR